MNGRLIHPSGLMKEVKIGYSWTMLFFGAFPPLFRGDFKWFFLCLVGNMCTFGFFSLVFSFFYNQQYIKDLIEKGYQPADIATQHGLLSKGIQAKLPEK